MRHSTIQKDQRVAIEPRSAAHLMKRTVRAGVDRESVSVGQRPTSADTSLALTATGRSIAATFPRRVSGFARRIGDFATATAFPAASAAS